MTIKPTCRGGHQLYAEYVLHGVCEDAGHVVAVHHWIHTCLFVCVCVCAFVYLCVCVCVCVCVYVCVFVCMCLCVCVCVMS
jgi:hypothetical protein